MSKLLVESRVEKLVRKHLEKNGWTLTNLPRTVGQHGCDITAWHPRWRKVLLIEAKGEGSKHKNQVKHAAFYNLLGQVLSRMDKAGNAPNKGRIYAIAIPAHWGNAFRTKIKKMRYGWRLLKLRTYLVSRNGTVTEKSWSKMK